MPKPRIYGVRESDQALESFHYLLKNEVRHLWNFEATVISIGGAIGYRIRYRPEAYRMAGRRYGIVRELGASHEWIHPLCCGSVYGREAGLHCDAVKAIAPRVSRQFV